MMSRLLLSKKGQKMKETDLPSSLRPLAILDGKCLEWPSVRWLRRLGLECAACTPQEAPELLRGAQGALPFIILALDYESVSGAQVAWWLRREYPSVPIVMLAAQLVGWEPSDLFDCGINILIDQSEGEEAFRQQMRPLLDVLGESKKNEAKPAEYEQVVTGIVGQKPGLVRLIDSRRLILYENAEMQSAAGKNEGRSCFPFWDNAFACIDCIALAALEGGREVRKYFKTQSGKRGVVTAVPVILHNRECAVLEVYRFNEKTRDETGDSSKASHSHSNAKNSRGRRRSGEKRDSKHGVPHPRYQGSFSRQRA